MSELEDTIKLAARVLDRETCAPAAGTAQPFRSADRCRFAGFSSAELLRRARVLRDIAEDEPPRKRHQINRLALEHEDAARRARGIVAGENAVEAGCRSDLMARENGR